MKFLLDENLSHRLVPAISDLFPGTMHITEAGISNGASDRAIWDFARSNGYSILTADNDFAEIAEVYGQPPKIILHENCDYPTNVASTLIRAKAAELAEFELDSRAILILRMQEN